MSWDAKEIRKLADGSAAFVDDLPLPDGSLIATVFCSPYAHCRLKKLDLTDAKGVEGVVDVLDYSDIPGENQVGVIVQDEPLLAESECHFIGQPIALILSDTKQSGIAAREKIRLDTEPLEVIVDPREAFKKGAIIAQPRTFACGDTGTAWESCDTVVEGRVDSGAQEHFYLETQAALAVPQDGDRIMLFSSTQSPTGVQKVVSNVLNIPQHRVEVDVRRLGGGFGGKEDQASIWSALAALGAFRLKRPVKMVLNRAEDILFTGKRHPYSSDYKIGLNGEGMIIAYEATLYQNAGASADLSTAILERSLFHGTGSYHIPNVKITAVCCRTHTPPNTAFRGFGAPQAMFLIESAIGQAANRAGLNIRDIQRKNLLREGDRFPYGMEVTGARADICWDRLNTLAVKEGLYKKIDAFNRTHALKRRGAYMMPVCFGISFTNKMLNQAGSLVHVYSDGSVSVSTGAVEMGQGVNRKIKNIVAELFSISTSLISVESTNTSRVANTSPTAASSGADLNGKATEIACHQISDRLLSFIKEKKGWNGKHVELQNAELMVEGKAAGIDWRQLVSDAYVNRIHLSAQGYYTTPDIYFDRKLEKGKPFAYHVYGCAYVETELDCLRGTYRIRDVRIVHDLGRSLDMGVDRGQIFGAFIQGAGWMTMEELTTNSKGQLENGNCSAYKVPDIHFTPDRFELLTLEDDSNPHAVFGSKAVGEPPFMYGIGVFFSIIEGMKSYRAGRNFEISAPITPEKVLIALYEKKG